MKITSVKGLLVVGMAGLFLTACACSTSNRVDHSEAEVAPAPVEPPPAAPEPVAAVHLAPSINAAGGLTVYDPDDTTGTALQSVFYFDFDQAIVKKTGHSELDRHAEALKNNPAYSVRLEGHADERGTREYNLALGEKRALAIRAYLTNQSVSGRQMETISYGEERPDAQGSSERDRALNRRVVFKYSKQ